jgi:serine/threonine protein kinase/WD40 repeat protein
MPPTDSPDPPADPSSVRIICPHCGKPTPGPTLVVVDLTCPACGTTFLIASASATRHDPSVPLAGRFRYLATLGHGSFGTVYKAEDPKLGRVVAVKIPHPDVMAHPDGRKMFEQEAKAAATLRHTGIVTLYEVETTSDVPAIVCEYVDGVTLRDRLTAGRPTFRESAELVAAIADALDHAHRSRVVHRDVKPANVLLDRDGRPHLADFGLARRDDPTADASRGGEGIGTPAYMSPEQVTGQPEADGRTDVYSLGIVLYELLANRVPFTGNSAAVMDQHRNKAPTPPRQFDRGIPLDLQMVCLKCLAKSPDKRYSTAGELAADLRRWLDGKPVLARPVGRVERAVRWARRNPVVAILSATLLVALVAGTSISTTYAILYSHKAKEHEETAKELEGTVRKLKQKSDDLNASLRLSQKQEGELSVQAGQAACERGEVDLGLLRLAHGLVLLEENGGDPEDKQAARLALSLWGQHRDPQRRIPVKSDWFKRVRLGEAGTGLFPDGQSLLLWDRVEGGRPEVHLASPYKLSCYKMGERKPFKDYEIPRSLEGHSVVLESLAVASDGDVQHVAAVVKDFGVRAPGLMGATFVPADSSLVEWRVIRWNAGTGAVEEQTTVRGIQLNVRAKQKIGAKFSPRLHYAAVPGGRGNPITLHNLTTRQVLTGPQVDNDTPANGVIFAADERTALIPTKPIPIGSIGSRESIESSEIAIPPQSPPDPEFRLWDLEQGQELLNLTGYEPLQYSPDGRWLVGFKDGAVHRWDLNSRLDGPPSVIDPRWTIRPDVRVQRVSFTPDGKWLIVACVDRDKERYRVWSWSDVKQGRDQGRDEDVSPADIGPGERFALQHGRQPIRWPNKKAGERPLPDQVTWFTPDGSAAVLANHECRDLASGHRLGPKLGYHQFGQNRPANGRSAVELFYFQSEDDRAALVRWRLEPVQGTVERIQTWAQVTTKHRLDENGDAKKLNKPEQDDRERRLEELGGSPLPP